MTAPLALAWRVAAADLGLRFVSPYRLSGRDQGEIWCCGLLTDFGGRTGTLLLGRFSSDEAAALAEGSGCYISGLNPLYYDYYDREQFEETLNDWGWFGDATAPAWFKGGLGRHGGPEHAA